jgi:hypothetical protein
MIRINDNGNIIDREMNDEELAVHEADVEFYKKKEAAELANKKAKADLLAKLGITAEEAALLLG